MSPMPVDALVRAELLHAVKRLEALLLPHAGFTRGHRVYLPEAGDAHEALKRALIQHALDVYSFGHAVLGGSVCGALPRISDQDVADVERTLMHDVELDIYVELLTDMQDVLTAATSLELIARDGQLDDHSEALVDRYVQQVLDALTVEGTLAQREAATLMRVRDACRQFHELGPVRSRACLSLFSGRLFAALSHGGADTLLIRRLVNEVLADCASTSD